MNNTQFAANLTITVALVLLIVFCAAAANVPAILAILLGPAVVALITWHAIRAGRREARARRTVGTVVDSEGRPCKGSGRMI